MVRKKKENIIYVKEDKGAYNILMDGKIVGYIDQHKDDSWWVEIKLESNICVDRTPLKKHRTLYEAKTAFESQLQDWLVIKSKIKDSVIG